MTMALESSTLSALIAMDNTFASRCSLRKSLVSTQRCEVVACNPVGRDAVRELYVWLTTVYLPTRFPSVYEKVELGEGVWGLRNEVTGDVMPFQLAEGEEEEMLKLLGENVDTEFLIMLPDQHHPPKENADGGGETIYRLHAFINCFPSGFNTREKLGMVLDDIHAPVPGYKKKCVTIPQTSFPPYPNTNIHLFPYIHPSISLRSLALHHADQNPDSPNQ
jgi:hypothetical protein